MAESEGDVYRRIAKQNGTSEEHERAKDAERERLRRLANGEDVASGAASSDVVIPTRTPPDGANPFVNALIGVYIVSFIVGLILIAIGVSNAGSYDPGGLDDHTDNGVAWIVWGGAFVSLGITATMVHLGSAAVLWQLERTKAQNS